MKKWVIVIALLVALYLAAGYLYRMQAASKLTGALQTDITTSLRVKSMDIPGFYLSSSSHDGEATIVFSELRQGARGMEEKEFTLKVRIDGRFWPINVGYYDVEGASGILNAESLRLLYHGRD